MPQDHIKAGKMAQLPKAPVQSGWCKLVLSEVDRWGLWQPCWPNCNPNPNPNHSPNPNPNFNPNLNPNSKPNPGQDPCERHCLKN